MLVLRNKTTRHRPGDEQGTLEVAKVAKPAHDEPRKKNQSVLYARKLNATGQATIIVPE